MAERGWPARRGAELRLAVGLMTRLPVGRIAEPVPGLAAAAWALPVAGGVAAVLPALVFWAAFALVPPGLAAALALAAGIAVTGALHEDGLADVADGFGGGATRARKLEIMRDSRIGSYGALALGLALAIRLLGLAAAPGGAAGALAILAVGPGSRAFLPALMAWLPPARGDGLAATGAGGAWVAAAAIGLLPLALLPGPAVPIALLAVAAGGMALLARRQIGGFTGDVLGATQQVGELALWLALAALWRAGY